MPREYYARFAGEILPVVRSALAGRWKLRRQPSWVEEWIARALLLLKNEADPSLEDVLEAADHLNHAVPTADEMAWLLWHLQERGWLSVNDNQFRLTSEGALQAAERLRWRRP